MSKKEEGHPIVSGPLVAVFRSPAALRENESLPQYRKFVRMTGCARLLNYSDCCGFATKVWVLSNARR